MLSIKHVISIVLRQICFSLCRLVPKEKKLVLCTAWFGQKYIDNPKYVFEFLLNNSDYKVLWLTRSNGIYKQLKNKGKPVAKFNSLIGIWKQIRAQAIFTTVQLSEFNSFCITNVIHIDLGHGHPVKDPGAKSWNKHVFRVEKMYLKHNNFHAVCSSIFSGEKLLEIIPNMDKTHIHISDMARNDVFVDKDLQLGKNTIVDKYKNGLKAIVYMPTHRSDGKSVMHMDELLPLNELQQLCQSNGYVFIIKKHFYHRNEFEKLEKYPNIYDITSIDDIDPQVLLCQADILISDYSACYIDYLLLDRPILFYQYDYDIFQKNERTLYFPFSTLNIAPIAYDKKELVEKLQDIIMSPDKFSENRRKFIPTYFANASQNKGRYKVKLILDKLMDLYYPNN